MTPTLSRRMGWVLASVIIFSHVLIVIHAQTKLSPTWDEIAYPAAGLVQLKTGNLVLNTVNPFLSKLFYAAPLLLVHPQLPFSHPSWINKDEYRFGFAFTFRNNISPKLLIALSRLPLILFTIGTAVLLFLLGQSCWGVTGGLVTLLSYVTTPVFLARASVAQLEMPVYFLIVAALWLHILWFKNGNIYYLVASGIFTGLSFLGKFIGIPFLLALVLLNFFCNPQTQNIIKRTGYGMILPTAATLTVVLGTLPWHGGSTALRDMALNIIQFDKILPFYWHGRLYENANSLLSLGAFFIKAPLHILLFSLIGMIFWMRSRMHRIEMLHLIFIPFLSFFSVLFFKNAVSTVQLSPAYIGLVGLSGGLVANQLSHKKTWVFVTIFLFVLGGWDVFSVHPNYLAYFNRTVGGSINGYKWLADSDQDWGQSLPALGSYLKKENSPGVIFCYSGSGDPQAYGISYQDLFSPALVTKERMDQPLPTNDGKVLLVIGTKLLQSQPELFDWVTTNLTPKTMIGHTFLVYDVSNNSSAFRWMADIYSHTNRSERAAWCLTKAKESISRQMNAVTPQEKRMLGVPK